MKKLFPAIAWMMISGVSAQAATLVYDGFGDAPDIGLSGSWSFSGGSVIENSTPLDYPGITTDVGATSPGSMRYDQGSSRTASRDFSSTITMSGTQSDVWFGWIGAGWNGNGSQSTGVALQLAGVTQVGTTTDPFLGPVTLDVIGATSQSGGVSYNRQGNALEDDESFQLVHINYNSGTDQSTISLWAAEFDNPLDLSNNGANLGAANASIVITGALSFDSVLVSFTNGPNGYVDEIRVGDDFDSVIGNVPIPEPSTYALLGLGLGGILLRRRSRKI